MEKEVRVRFAPSPTGALHIGGVRTALYNYLFAKKMGGKMLLRIEDTDQTRFVEGAEDYIQKAMAWSGIELDESPWNPGEVGPYRQSERKPMYMEYAQKLIDEGNAYYAFDTPEELTEMRERLKAARVASPQYNSVTRTTMKNSLTLPEDEVKAKLEAGEPYVIRMKIPRKEEIRINDMIRGWVMVHSSAVDDKVLMKSDGMPTYHLANIVDDHLMGITHVIRGEEWLPSAPLHVLLYRYLGWEDEMPKFAHLPLILKPDGNGKLSKRDADKHGYPVFPMNWTDPETGNVAIGFKDEGYLPEATINFLAFLGWNPGTHEELFDMESLIKEFTVERIGKSGTKFDIQKANWFNEQYLRAKTDEQLLVYLKEDLTKEGIEVEDAIGLKICSLMKERATFPADLWKNSGFFFSKPTSYDEKVIRKKWNDQVADVLSTFANQIGSNDVNTPEAYKELLLSVLEEKGMKIGQVMQSLRVVITGEPMGPDLMSILEILGKQEVIERLEAGVQNVVVNG